MKIAVIGAGAIGCVTGALLWDKGYDAALIGRADQVDAINSSGLVIDGVPGGKRYDVPAKAALDFEPGVIFLAVKTQDVEAACRDILPWSKGASVVTMQNGVKSDEIAGEALGRERIISAVVMFGATYLEPGRVTYNFPASGLVIGKAFPVNSEDGLLEEVHGVLSSAFEVHVSPDIHGTHWSKLILNLSNVLAGILGMGLGEVFEDPRLCRLGVMVMKEACGAMEDAGIRLMPLPELTVEKLKSLLDAPLDVSSGIYGNIMRGLSRDYLPGSVLQSVKRGRPSEVDYLNGEIAVLGLRRRYPTPLNYKLTKLMKEVERSGRSMGKEELFKEIDV
jgi:2-dehydropantoate 2-reductase